MQIFKRSTAWLMVLCLLLGLALSVGPLSSEVNAEEFNPYVYRLGPNSDLIPDYYLPYANFHVAWSSHEVLPDNKNPQIVILYNLTNVTKLQPTKPADFEQNPRYASVSAFCVDLGTSVDYTGTFYRAANLEEAHFGIAGDSAAKNRVDHIRAILRHGLQYIDNPVVVQEATNEYLGSQLVKGLTGGELGSAIQAALWHYANGATYETEVYDGWHNKGKGPYLWTADFSWEVNSGYVEEIEERCISQYEPMNVWETFTSPDVNRVYNYLINLPGESARDRLITKDDLTLEDTVISGTSDDCTMTLMVDVNGLVDDNDQLVLTAQCGDRTESVKLGKDGITPTKDGLFPITLSDITAEDCAEVELELTGSQTVNDGVFYEAKPKDGKNAQKASQGFASFGAEDIPVDIRTTENPVFNSTVLEITKVDAKSGNPLSGVTFDLYMKQDGDDLKIGSYTTDKNGKISVPVVGTDEYYFVETEALPGYEAVTGNVTAGRVPNSWNAGSLEVTKKLINETPAKPDETFDFKLILDLSTAPIMSNGISWMTADYLKGQLESSKNLTWSVSGNKLTAAFTLKADETVTVDSIPLGATYTLEEIMTAEDKEWFTVTSKVDSNAAKNSNLANGTINAKNAVVFTNSVVTGEAALGELAVSKKLVNNTPAQVGETFNFKITLDLSTADAITNGAPWMTEEYLMGKISCDEKLDWTKKDGKYTSTFTVDADETVTIKGIAQGATYTVEEVLTAEDQEWFTVTSKVDGQSAKDSNIANGTVAAKNSILFTNTVATTDMQLGNLNVSKKLVNETPAVVGETFNFKITVDFSTAKAYENPTPWLDDAYLLGKISSTENLTWTEKNGKYTATFTVDADETVTIKDIAYGTTYTVEEVLTAEDREKFTVTSKVGNEDTQNSNIAEGSIASLNAILFTNTVNNADLQLGNLNVSKKLVNETPAVVGETFNFRVTLDLSTADVYENPVFWMNDEYLLGKISSTENLTWTEKDGKYTATFTVDADETVTIKGLAYGTTYKVEEILTSEDRAWFNVTTKVGNEAEQNSDAAQGAVASLNSVLFTNTVVTGDELRLGDLAVSKKLVNETPAVVGETFNFKVTIDLSTADAYKNPAPWLNDEYLLGKISSTENLTWTEKNGKYTATFTVDADETVIIKGLAYGISYTVEEILTDENREQFTVTSQVNNETEKNSDTATGTVAQRNAVQFTNSVVNQTVELGSLNVSKKLVNETPAVVGETFNFQITIDLSTADVYENPVFWMNDEYLLGKIGSTENLTWTEKDGKYTATFTVDADETVTINGIAQGTSYTVEEVLTAEDRAWFTVTSQVGNEAVQNSSTANGSIATLNAVLFTNTVTTSDVPLGSLNVSKKLVNETPAVVGETFNFRVTIDLSTADAYKNPAPWLNDEYLLGKISSTENLSWTEKNGKYTANFTVDADETVIIKGLAYGITYTVEEILTAENREQFTVTNQVNNETEKNSDTATGTVAQRNAVQFTNSVVNQTVELGNLNVSKKLVNETPAVVGETFNFKITVDLSAADAYTNPVFWMNDEYLLGKISSTENLTWTEKDGKYTATFTVDADETVTINGIAQGTSYTVEEVLTAEDRAWFTVTSQVGNEAVQNSSTAKGSIAAQNAVLFTNTVTTSDVLLGSLNVSKKLVNETPAVVGETFNFRITVDLSTADAYTNPVFWMNDEYLLGKISSTENLTWTEKDGKYTATFTVDADETVTINGIAQGTSYTVEEVLTAEERNQFAVTSQVGNAAAQNSSTAEGSVAAQNTVLFTNSVVNQTVELGDLNVSKKLVNETPAVVGETFNFQITIDLSTANVYENPVFWMNDEYLLGFIDSTKNLTWTEKDGKYTAAFTVDADETVIISGIAQGATYTVEEILTAEEQNRFTVTSQVGNAAAQNSSTAEGSVAELNAVLFTNSVATQNVEMGTLDVSKKLINTTPAEVGEIFNFQITLDLSTADVYIDPVFWMNDEYLMRFVSCTEDLNWTSESGKYIASFTVKADETVTIRSIPQGATYTVREILTEEEREWFNSTAQVGDDEAIEDIVAQSTVAERNAVIFTNSVVTTEVELGSLDISKKLINTTPAKVGETFNFRITLDLSTADVYTDAVFWMNDEYLMSFVSSTEDLVWTAEDGKYTATFTVDAGETVTIDGIAKGAAYTVQEILTEEDRAWFTTTSQIGEEEAKDSDTVESTVAEENAVLFTNSVVDTEVEQGKLQVTKKLTKSSKAKTYETFNFRIVLDLAQADVYQNPVPWMYDEYLLAQIESNQELTWTKSGEKKYTATFTLKADETITVDGIPQGAGYTLEEVLSESDRKLYKVRTAVATDGGQSVETAATLVSDTVALTNSVIFTNEYMEQLPTTDDLSLTAPVVLCLMSVLMGAVLMLNKRRLIG